MKAAIPLALIAFSIGVAVHLHAPLTYWDTSLLSWANDPAPHNVPAGTSPLYLTVLRASVRTGLRSPAALRIFQAIGALFSAWVAMRLGTLLGGSNAGRLTFILYLLNPAVIQGVQSLDMADASFYPGAFCLWLLAFARPEDESSNRLVSIGGRGAHAFAWKITSSLGLFLYPAAAFLLNLRKWRGWIATALATMAGFAVAGLCWWTFQSWEPFSVSGGSATGALRLRESGALALHLMMAAFWLGPFLLILAGIGAWQARRRTSSGLIVGTVLYLAIYFALQGLNHGFPRYQMAVLPLLCAWAAAACAKVDFARWDLVGGVVLAALFVFSVRDPLYALNVSARRAFLDGTLMSLGVRLVIWGVVYLVVLGIAARVFRWDLAKVLLIGTVAICVALVVVQSRADYSTAYSYGESGRAEVVRRISAGLRPGSAVLVAPNLEWDAQQAGFQVSALPDWTDRESILSFIRRSQPGAIALDVTGNTTWQLQWLLKDPPAEVKGCYGRYQEIGTYWVCLLR